MIHSKQYMLSCQGKNYHELSLLSLRWRSVVQWMDEFLLFLSFDINTRQNHCLSRVQSLLHMEQMFGLLICFLGMSISYRIKGPIVWPGVFLVCFRASISALPVALSSPARFMWNPTSGPCIWARAVMRVTFVALVSLAWITCRGTWCGATPPADSSSALCVLRPMLGRQIWLSMLGASIRILSGML